MFSICYFTIIRCGPFCLSLMTPRPLRFPSPFGEGAGVRPRGRGGVSVVLYLPLSAFNSLYLQSKRCLRKLNNFTISLFKPPPSGRYGGGFHLGEVWWGFPFLLLVGGGQEGIVHTRASLCVFSPSLRGRVGERLSFPPPSRGRSGGDCPIVQLFNCPIVKSIYIAKILQRAQKKRLRNSYA